METNKLDEQIKKFGGADEAYRIKLKETIRDAMGYSNFVSAGKAAQKKSLDLGAMKGNITPQGVKSIVGSAMGNRQLEANTQFDIAGAYDTAAGSIAAKRIAESKAAATAAKNAMGVENSVAFTPESELDRQILEYMQNPKNADGSVKSLQQFESELNKLYSSPEMMQSGPKSVDENGNPIPYQVWSQEDINKRIAEKVPKDFIGNEDKYHLMAQGYSANQAEENAGALRYNTMTPQEKLFYENAHPTMANKLKANSGYSAFLKEASEQNEDGTPKWTIEELTAHNPSMTQAEIVAAVGPTYKKAAVDDLDGIMKEEVDGKRNIDALKIAYTDGVKKSKTDSTKVTGLSGIEMTQEYKEIVNNLTQKYGAVMNGAEIDRFVKAYVLATFKPAE